MDAVVQYVIVALIIAFAIIVVILKAVRLFQNKRNSALACAGCPLINKCSKSIKDAKKCNDNLAQSRN